MSNLEGSTKLVDLIQSLMIDFQSAFLSVVDLTCHVLNENCNPPLFTLFQIILNLCIPWVGVCKSVLHPSLLLHLHIQKGVEYASARMGGIEVLG